MDPWEPIIKNVLDRMGFIDYRVEAEHDRRKISAFIYDHPPLIKENLPAMVESVNHILWMIAKRNDLQPIFFDINNYRQERESLIAELARAAAKKVLQTKKRIQLPAMNSYERRLVHIELAVHPEVTTESIGAGKERYVIIKPLDGETRTPDKTATHTGGDSFSGLRTG